jgi:hypothetical protein
VADFPPCDDVCGALEEHVRRCFAGHDIEALTWDNRRARRRLPHFRALRIAPLSPRGIWTYVSTGGWATTDGHPGLEFILRTPAATPEAVKFLAQVVWFHAKEGLGEGHTLPNGGPWLPGSKCDHILVSLPYPFGPDLQRCHVGDKHIEFLWLLPITRQERDYKATHGLDALESRFEEADLRYWQIDRPSVV